MTAVPFGLNARMQNSWWYQGGGMELGNEFFKKFGVIGIPLRQHRHPDGRLVPQGDQDASPISPASSSASAASPGRCCRRSASCRSSSPAATSIRRSKRARSTRPNGSALMTTRSSASKSRAILLLSRLLGGRPTVHAFCNLEKWNALPKNYQAIIRTRRRMPTAGWRRDTTCRTRRR